MWIIICIDGGRIIPIMNTCFCPDENICTIFKSVEQASDFIKSCVEGLTHDVLFLNIQTHEVVKYEKINNMGA